LKNGKTENRMMEKAVREQERLRKLKNVLPENISEICKRTESYGRYRIRPNREEGWKMVTRLNTKYHRRIDSPQGKEAKFNRKFIRPDESGGSVEAVICFAPGKEPYLVTDEVNAGTYNFVSPIKREFPYVTPRSVWGHWKKDLLPYLRLLYREKRERKHG